MTSLAIYAHGDRRNISAGKIFAQKKNDTTRHICMRETSTLCTPRKFSKKFDHCLLLTEKPRPSQAGTPKQTKYLINAVYSL